MAYHAMTKLESPSSPKTTQDGHAAIKYQQVFGQWLCWQAKRDERLVAITPAMKEGSGMVDFAKQFPERFFDVAIAEQHAITFAAGLATQGLKSVVAIYSTFLQRAYDQLIHDVALQTLDITFAVDRAGLVGEDGATHHGNFDIAFLRCIPNLVIAAPSDEHECHQLLNSAYQHSGPAIVRYPRGKGTGIPFQITDDTPAIGKARLIRKGNALCILNFGALLHRVTSIADNDHYGLCDMRWIKPLNTAMIEQLCKDYDCFAVLEDASQHGGAASAVMEYLHSQGHRQRVLTLNLPDQFCEHGERNALLQQYGLSSDAISQRLKAFLGVC